MRPLPLTWMRSAGAPLGRDPFTAAQPGPRAPEDHPPAPSRPEERLPQLHALASCHYSPGANAARLGGARGPRGRGRPWNLPPGAQTQAEAASRYWQLHGGHSRTQLPNCRNSALSRSDRKRQRLSLPPGPQDTRRMLSGLTFTTEAIGTRPNCRPTVSTAAFPITASLMLASGSTFNRALGQCFKN